MQRDDSERLRVGLTTEGVCQHMTELDAIGLPVNLPAGSNMAAQSRRGKKRAA